MTIVMQGNLLEILEFIKAETKEVPEMLVNIWKIVIIEVKLNDMSVGTMTEGEKTVGTGSNN